MNSDRLLRWLDDRSMELYRLDQAIRLGRIEGEAASTIFWTSGAPHKYERTNEYRLMRHYEREYKRIARGATP